MSLILQYLSSHMLLGNGQFRVFQVPRSCVYYDSRSTSVTESLHGTSFVSLPIISSPLALASHASRATARPLVSMPTALCLKSKRKADPSHSARNAASCASRRGFIPGVSAVPSSINPWRGSHWLLTEPNVSCFTTSRKHSFLNGASSKEIHSGVPIITKWPKGFGPRVRFVRGLSCDPTARYYISTPI